MNSLSINDEYRMLSSEQDDTVIENYRASREQEHLDNADYKAALDAYVNDHSHMLRGADGSIHTELQPDTIIEIDGMEMTYQVAQITGLLDKSDTKVDSQGQQDLRAEIPNTVQLSNEVSGQNAYAEKLIGSDAFESAMMGDENIINDLSNKAGVSPEVTRQMLEKSYEEYAGNALDYVYERIENFNEDHLRAWYESSAVSQSKRQEVLRSMRRGQFDGVESLLEEYKRSYKLR